MTRVFRWLIAFDFVVVLASAAVSWAEPPGLAQPFVARYGEVAVAAAVIAAVAVIVGLPLVGLAFFRRWARPVVTIQAALYVAASAALGAAETSGFMTLLSIAENMLLGAILALAYSPPLRDGFRRDAGASPNAR